MGPGFDWIIRDTPSVKTPEWRDLRREAGVVVNAAGALHDGGRADLTKEDSRSLPELVQAIRRWQGLHEEKLRLPLPSLLLKASSAVADLLGLAVPSRRLLRPGLIGMIAVSLGYVICGSVLPPDI